MAKTISINGKQIKREIVDGQELWFIEIDKVHKEADGDYVGIRESLLLEAAKRNILLVINIEKKNEITISAKEFIKTAKIISKKSKFEDGKPFRIYMLRINDKIKEREKKMKTIKNNREKKTKIVKKIYGEIKNGKVITEAELKKYEGKAVEIRIIGEEKRRTLSQNAALHLWFTKLAEALNDAGWDMRKTIKGGIEIPWTPASVKEYLWRPVQKQFLKKKSTTELNRQEDIDKIYDIINRTISERTGVSVPFPSIEELMMTIENENEQSKKRTKT